MPDPTSTTAALIVAAGRGHRMGQPIPKQYLPLGGRPVLAHTLAQVLAAQVDMLAVVIHPDDRALYDQAVASVAGPRLLPPVAGGTTRAQSVRLGLEALAPHAPMHVLIHDAARPFVAPALIDRVTEALARNEGAFAAIPVVDALWSADGDMAHEPVPRAGMWRAQTPQGFRFDAILAAHRAADTDAADDVAIARAAGLRVRIIEGAEENFKITTQSDLARAEIIHSSRR